MVEKRTITAEGGINKMSVWYDVEKENIDFSENHEEIHILFDSDNYGNNYVSIKTKDIMELLKDLMK